MGKQQSEYTTVRLLLRQREARKSTLDDLAETKKPVGRPHSRCFLEGLPTGRGRTISGSRCENCSGAAAAVARRLPEATPPAGGVWEVGDEEGG